MPPQEVFDERMLRAAKWTLIVLGPLFALAIFGLIKGELIVARWQDVFNPPANRILNAWLSTGVLLLGCPVVFSVGLYLAKANAGTSSTSNEGIGYFLFLPIFGILIGCASLVCLTVRALGFVIVDI